ncbi:hypothetical protein [Streptomyces mirabilis]|uniref:hypothetical protein n=1 Tax=Streptomyces mirabilis TaxID=68239 RepID=UPI00364F6E73
MAWISYRHIAHPGHAQPIAPPYQGTDRPTTVTYPNKPRAVRKLVMAVGPKAARPVP